MSQQVALLCTLSAASPEKKDQVLALLDAAKSYYRDPHSQCTTWCYFTPSSRLKVPSDMVAVGDRDTTIAGLEIYTAKSALTIQLDSPMYKDFHAKVEADRLYGKAEKLEAWYPAAGYISRGEVAKPFGNGVLVLMGRHICQEGTRDRLVELLGVYADWVKQNEPGFLTYSIMIRPKAPNEVLVFERCQSPEAFQSHVQSLRFKESLRAVMPFIKTPKGQEWTELDNAFVGNVLGGDRVTAQKL